VPLAVFPVDPSGVPTFSNDFGAPRSGGRTHTGTDVFAREGAPVRAVDSGTITQGGSKTGGNIVFLRADDGQQYMYAHLLMFDGVPRRVAAGDVIGFVGHTGNATAALPHVHFEISPTGNFRPRGDQLNPFDPLRAVAPAGAVVRLPGQPALGPVPVPASTRLPVPELGLILIVAAFALASSSRSPRRRRRRRA